MDALTLEVLLANSPDELVEAYGVHYHARCVRSRIERLTAGMSTVRPAMQARLGGPPMTTDGPLDRDALAELLVPYVVSGRQDATCAECADRAERAAIRANVDERMLRQREAQARAQGLNSAQLYHMQTQMHAQLQRSANLQADRLARDIDNRIMQELLKEPTLLGRLFNRKPGA